MESMFAQVDLIYIKVHLQTMRQSLKHWQLIKQNYSQMYPTFTRTKLDELIT